MVRHILFSIITLFLFIGFSYTQCDVNINASTLTVPCGGGNVDLTAIGSGNITTPINNDFNAGNAGPGWNISPAGQFDNPCSPGVDGTTHMWMGNTTAAPRTLQTNGLDLSCGGNICFDLLFATQGGPAPCEGPDLVNEGVFLQYSTDGGASWNVINNFAPLGGNNPQLTNWNNYCFPIPPAAQTTNTIINWFQGGSSGPCCDHWGIDNVVISATGCNPIWYDWSNIPGTTGPAGDGDSQTVFVESDTTFTVTYTDGMGFSCSEDITITIDGMGNPTTNTTDEICLGDHDGTATVTEGAGGVGPYTFTLTAGPSSPQTNATGNFNGLEPGNYTVEVSDDGSSCTTTDDFTIAAGPQCCFITVNADITEPVCDVNGELACTGAITVNDNDGIGDVVYSIDNGATTQNGNVFNDLCDGTYDILVEDDNNCTASTTVTLTNPPMPTADFTFTEVCEDLNSEVNSTSNVPAPGMIQTLEWDMTNNGSSDYSTANVSHDYNGYGTYDVLLSVTTDAGCKDEITQSIEVYPLPVVDFDADAVCLDFANTFQDQTDIPNGGVISNWDWNFDDGNTDNTQNPQHEYASFGIFDVTLEVTSGHGCVSSVSNPVEVYELPTADFDFVNDCFYEEIEFQNTSSANAIDFEWMFDDGSSPVTTGNPNHLYTTAGIYDVALITTTNNNCKDTINNLVTAYPKPTAAFSVDETCLETNSVYTDNSSVTDIDGDVISNWNWDFGDGGTSTQQNPTHLYQGENIYQSTLIITTNHGCRDTITEDAVVWPLPYIDFSPTDVCLGFDTQFQDESTISNQFTNNSIVSWNWDFGEGGTSTQQNPTYTYQADGIYHATLEATSNHGCTNDSIIDVTVHPKPASSFTGTNLFGCSPLCFTLNSTAVVNTPSNIVNYEWTLSDGTVYSSSTPDVNDCFDNLTGNNVNYGVELKVTTNMGCVDTHFEANYIQVFHNPIADFDYSPEDVSILDPTIEMTNNSQYADTYEWHFENWGPSTEYEPIVEFAPQPNSHEVVLVTHTDEGCTDTVSTVIDIKDKLILYVPNTFTPDQDDYNEVFSPVFTSGFDPYSYNLKIFNRWGEIVFESNDNQVGWDGTYGVDNGKIVNDGTYIWKIEFKENGVGKRQVIKGHVNVLR